MSLGNLEHVPETYGRTYKKAHRWELSPRRWEFAAHRRYRLPIWVPRDNMSIGLTCPPLALTVPRPRNALAENALAPLTIR